MNKQLRGFETIFSKPPPPKASAELANGKTNYFREQLSSSGIISKPTGEE